MMNKQSAVSFTIRSVLSFLVLTLLTALIHEGAHLAFAAIVRVPIESFSWFNTRYLAPGFISGPTENALGLTVIGYAGGLVTGTVLLTILIRKRDWFKRSEFRWLLGCYMATLGFWQLCQGILEGAFHDMYISNATDIFSLTYGIGYASTLLGMVLYFLSMPSPTELETHGIEHTRKI